MFGVWLRGDKSGLTLEVWKWVINRKAVLEMDANQFVNQSWLAYRERSASQCCVCAFLSDTDKPFSQNADTGAWISPQISEITAHNNLKQMQLKTPAPSYELLSSWWPKTHQRVMIFILWLLSCCCKYSLHALLLKLSHLNEYLPTYLSRFTKTHGLGVSWNIQMSSATSKVSMAARTQRCLQAFRRDVDSN